MIIADFMYIIFYLALAEGAAMTTSVMIWWLCVALVFVGLYYVIQLRARNRFIPFLWYLCIFYKYPSLRRFILF